MSTPSNRGRLAYLAFDVPHKGQASYVHIHEIIDNLSRLGWQIDLFAPQPLTDRERRDPLGKIAHYYRVIRDAIARLDQYDCLYVRAHPFAWPVTFAARRRGMLIAQEVNGTELDVVVRYSWLRLLRPLVRWIYFSQYRASDHLFPVTEELNKWLRESTGHPMIKTVPNAANTDLFRPIDRVPSDPFAVFFGSLTAWHGADTMIDAVRHPHWPAAVKLVVIGSGVKSNIVEEAVRSGLPVQWLGMRNHEEIPQLIAGAIASLIVISNPQLRSSTGVLPLKLYESLACGIPAIVSDLPGQAELVRNERCGLIIPSGDAAALADAVARLTMDSKLGREMGRRGAALVKEKHSWAARAAVIDAELNISRHGVNSG